MSLAALIGIDKERYDAGNKFLSQNPYLQNFQARAPITFNVSPNMNTGIMSSRIYPYPPIIPQEGGDGGGIINPNRNTKFDYETEAYGLKDLSPEEKGITQEEQDIINAQINKDRLRTAAELGLFALNPVGYAIGKGINKTFGFVKDKFFGGSDNDGDGGPGPDINPGTFTAESLSSSFDSEEGPAGGSTSTASTAGDAPGYSGPSPFEYGGRVGYSNGGLSKYEIFKLGELGYNTKGGTVTAPFGGIKVLRDILRVNQYAGGGRVGYRNGGYSSEDNEEQQAIDQASFDAGNRTDDYTDMYGGDGNNNDNNPPPTYSNNESPRGNLNFNLVEYIDPAFSYANRFGTLGGILNTTRTIQEEEPVGNIGYLDPSGKFGIGYDTDLGVVSNANLGNLNLGYTGVGGPTLNYMGGFANDAGRFGVNYNRDSGLNLGVSYNKKFNNGGIVGLYR